MAQKNFSDGQEITFQDLNDAQTHVRRELYDRVIYHILQKQGLGFFQDSFKALFVNGTTVNVSQGSGFQLDGTQVSPEPTHRLFFIPAIVTKTLSAPDGTNPRIDLIVAKALRVDSLTETRNFKDALTGVIAPQSTVVETDWLSDVQVVTGTPAGSPVAPAVPSGYVLVATLAVAAISGLASQSSITDNRVRIPVADDTYIDTTAFPAIITQTATARLKDVLLQLANFEFNHDSAIEIPASNSGHTVATGVNVQVQLDEIDALLTEYADVTNAIHGAFLIAYKYAVSGDWDLTRPLNVAAALDQLAARTRIVEAGTNIGPYIGASFNDYIKQAINNTGFTDNGSTNPRGIKLNDLQTKWGEERLYIQQIKQTGKFDANGLEEWAVTSPNHDIRIMLYGNWRNDAGANGYDGQLTQLGQFLWTKQPGDYILITAVCDGIGIIQWPGTDGSDAIEVDLDGANVATIGNRGSQYLQANAYNQTDVITGDTALSNLSYDLHTFKFINGATDSNTFMRLLGFVILTTGQKELGGSAYVNKAQQNFAPATISPPSLTSKGGKIYRYIDPADSTRKDAFQDVFEVNTAVTGSVGPSTTSLVVNNATGFVAPGIIEIGDGPLNWELVRYDSVNTFTNTLTLAAPGTLNSYTNPTVKMYARVGVNLPHANEKAKYDRHCQAFGSNERSYQGSYDPQYMGQGIGYSVTQGMSRDGVWALYASSGRIYAQAVAGNSRYIHGFTMNGNTNVMHVDFKGTGIDTLLDFGSADTAVFRVFLDGVELSGQTYVTPQGHPKWVTQAQDLPEGSHRLTFWCNGGTQNQVSFVSFKIYEASEPSAIATIPRGCMLSKRTKLGDYLYNPNHVVPSRGVLKQHGWQNTFLGNAVTNATSFGWSSSTYEVVNSVPTPASGYASSADAIEIDSLATNDVIRKWFYGTGLEALMLKSTNGGIVEFKIDGNLATAANFPGVTFQGGGGGYNTTTGLYDSYAGAQEHHKLSFSGLTEGWHEVQLRVTGTKNGSSSNYYCFFHGFYIIGAAYSDDVFNTGMQATSSVHLNGAKDLRLFDVFNLANIENPVQLHTHSTGYLYGGLNGIYVGLQGQGAFVETNGGDLEIDLALDGGGTAGNYFHAQIQVDGIYYRQQRGFDPSGGTNIKTATVTVPVPPGRHFVNGIAIGIVPGIESASMRIREVHKRRAQ